MLFRNYTLTLVAVLICVCPWAVSGAEGAAADLPPARVPAEPCSSDIYAAARNNDLAFVKQYVATKGDVNRPDTRGFTPLILAAYNESAEVLDFLIQHGATLHARDKSGSNALMAASFKGFVSIAARLLDAGARVNETSGNGGTALMFAALTGRTEVVQLLLKHGADVHSRDARGMSARDLAEQQGNEPMVALLEAAEKVRREPGTVKTDPSKTVRDEVPAR